MDVTAVALALVTLAAGLVAGWALAHTRSSGVAATAAAERDAARRDALALREERDHAETERRTAEGAAREAAARLDAERTASLERLAAERASTAEKLAVAEQAEQQLTDAFARLSGEALQRTNAQFLDLADARFKQAGAPLSETLTKVENQLREIEKERAGAQRELTSQIDFVRTTGERLREETASLVNALRKPQARGRWGEVQLRRCVEYAGMTDRCDFVEQLSLTTSEGTLRPDLVVRLAGGKHIVVDSKVTLAAYLEAHEATDPAVREERLAAHARHLRTHIDQLASKSYWSQLESSPEFVMLFVPGEAFLAPALDHDPLLFEHAWSKNVHIVTPTSLISSLRAVAYAWQQQSLADNAREVFELGRELHKRLGTMGGHVDKLGRSLTRAVNDYNSTVGSLESQVLVTARKLNELDVVTTELTELTGVEASVRPLSKPELVASAEQARAVVALPSGLFETTELTAAATAQHATDPPVELDRLADYGISTPGEPRAGSTSPGSTSRGADEAAG